MTRSPIKLGRARPATRSKKERPFGVNPATVARQSAWLEHELLGTSAPGRPPPPLDSNLKSEHLVGPLMRNPLFNGTLADDEACEPAQVAGSREYAPSGVIDPGLYTIESMSQVADLGPPTNGPKVRLHVVDGAHIRLRSVRADAQTGDNIRVAAEEMWPVNFSVAGGWHAMVGAGAVSEMLLIVNRGTLEIECGGDVRRLRANPDGDQSASGNIAFATLAQVGHNGGGHLPEVRVRAIGAPATGVVIWYAAGETQLSGLNVTAAHARPHGPCETSLVVYEVPTGEAALQYADAAEVYERKDYAHQSAVRCGLISVRNLRDDGHRPSLKNIDVRLLLLRGSGRREELDFVSHQNQEYLEPLHGGVMASILPGSFGSEKALVKARDERTSNSDFVPLVLAAAALSPSGDFDPQVILLDSTDRHGVKTSIWGDSVCLHVVQMKRAATRAKREDQPVAVIRGSTSGRP